MLSCTKSKHPVGKLAAGLRKKLEAALHLSFKVDTLPDIDGDGTVLLVLT